MELHLATGRDVLDASFGYVGGKIRLVGELDDESA
jgi:hypothetical protein